MIRIECDAYLTVRDTEGRSASLSEVAPLLELVADTGSIAQAAQASSAVVLKCFFRLFIFMVSLTTMVFSNHLKVPEGRFWLPGLCRLREHTWSRRP